MRCKAFVDIMSEWYTDRWGVLACFISVLLFAYSVKLTQWFSAKLKLFLPRRKTERDARIEALTSELRKTKFELEKLSPTDHFAAYFKKDRILLKHTDELKTLISSRQKDATVTSTLFLIAAGILVQLIALSLMVYSSSVIVTYINSSYFWPFNFMLHIPNVTPPKGRNDENNAETPVTLFAFLSLLIFAWQTARPRSSGLKTKSV
ncbi:unnamed protein product [Gongylonema pulchrum]|uniref:Guided entry of tail-anchored proteins factor 1 n=1 Tax=Gongylonema pulchrum TaxID=637853 RepID=A0A183DW58_9BILA|nr:unnamed protein product [Gongylonema pulchrum]